MAFDLDTVLTKILAIVEAVPDCVAIKGVPESITDRLVGYVTLIDFNTVDKAMGLLQMDAHFRVIFAYRISGNEGAGESAIAAAVASFINGFYTERRTDFGGTVVSADLDASGASGREYMAIAGQEFREYPIIVGITQHRNLP